MLSNYVLCNILLLAYCYITGAQILEQPVRIEPRVSKSASGGVCTPETNPLLRSQITNDIKQVFNSSILPQFSGHYRSFPAGSCADIYQGHPSGYYWLNVTNEPQLVYCSLNENRCCNDSNGKWMRIAYLNMSDPSAQCPDGWREVQSPIRTCRRQFNTSINSVSHTSYGIPYSSVCGRIIAYQLGTPDGFFGYNFQNQKSVDDAYVDGISITFGHPRNHIWTFTATILTKYCPCVDSGIAAPPFVNESYFCEVGIRNNRKNFFDSNTLWDGQDCAESRSATCCELNNPPWFCQQLPQPTTEDIEIRLIGFATGNNTLEDEDTPIKFIEIFVQ